MLPSSITIGNYTEILNFFYIYIFFIPCRLGRLILFFCSTTLKCWKDFLTLNFILKLKMLCVLENILHIIIDILYRYLLIERIYLLSLLILILYKIRSRGKLFFGQSHTSLCASNMSIYRKISMAEFAYGNNPPAGNLYSGVYFCYYYFNM